MADGELIFSTAMDTDGFDKGADKIKNSAKDVGNSAGSVFSKLGNLAKKAGKAVIAVWDNEPTVLESEDI